MQVCQLFREGVAGILGIENGALLGNTYGLCHRFDIPYLQTNWRRPIGEYGAEKDVAINFFPTPETLAMVT